MKLPCFTAAETTQPVTVDPKADEGPEPTVQTALLEAWQKGQLTLGFSGGGFLLPYHLGVYQALAIMGIANASTPMAGASAGSLVVASIKAGLTLQQQMGSFLEAAHNCRQRGVMGRLRAVLKAQLQKHLPPTAHVHCSDGTCWVSVTQVMPRPCNKLYGAFSSRRLLIKALLASCHLPRISDSGLFTSYKSIHKRCFDGGFSNLVPAPPAPPPAPAVPHEFTTATLELHARAATAAAATDSISTAGTTHAVGTARAVNTAGVRPPVVQTDSTKGISTRLGRIRSSSTSTSGPASRVLSGIRRLRSQSSSSSNSSGGSNSHAAGAIQAPEQLAANCVVAGSGTYVHAPGWFAVRVVVLPCKHNQFPAMFRAPTFAEVAIALDKFQEWPHDLNKTTVLALYPQEDDFLWELFERGRNDGYKWAQQHGFPADVLQRFSNSSSESNAVPPALRVVRTQGQQRRQQPVDVRQQQREAVAAEAAAAGVEEASRAVAAAAHKGV